MEELCVEYKDFSRNRGNFDPAFNLDDIYKNRNEGGFGIKGIGHPLLEEMLRQFQQEYRYIEVHIGEIKFYLTDAGKQLCESDWQDLQQRLVSL